MDQYKYINTNNINNAYYRAYDFSGNPVSCTIKVFDTWFTTPAEEVTYSMCSDVVTNYSPYHSTRVAINETNTWIDVKITDLVINWIDAATTTGYIYSENYGFVLSYSPTPAFGTLNKAFYPPGSTLYPPSIRINYSEDDSVDEGLYYIKNVSYGKYLDVENASTNLSGTSISAIVHPFLGGLNQLWKVEKVENETGLYRLRSMFGFTSPQYLNKIYIDAYASVYSTSDNFIFRLVQNLDGTYRIFCKGGTYTESALTAYNDPDSTNSIKEDTHFVNYLGNETQNWIFEPIEYSATVKDYYDNGMLTRWSMTDAQMQSGIKHWQDIAKEFYSSQFNIDITFSTPAKFASLSDACGYSSISVLDSHCTHSDTNHNSVDGNKNNFLASHSHSPKNTYVQWTGHVTYQNNAWLNDVGIHYGTTPSNNLHQGGYAMMRNLGVDRENGGSPTTTFTSDTMRAKRTYLHELAHAFGAVDSYCAGIEDGQDTCKRTSCVDCYKTNNPYEADCIMAKLHAPNMSDDMSTWLCDKCQEDISEYIMAYYHQVH